jgi:hypothetical protein
VPGVRDHPALSSKFIPQSGKNLPTFGISLGKKAFVVGIGYAGNETGIPTRPDEETWILSFNKTLLRNTNQKRQSLLTLPLKVYSTRGCLNNEFVI